MLTKTSIVFMYMRIFPNPKFHRIAWIVVVSALSIQQRLTLLWHGGFARYPLIMLCLVWRT